MRAKAGILIIICLLVLAGTVSADLPDSSTIETSNTWVIANGADQSKITVTASNMSSGLIIGATVQFSVNNTVYGSVSPQTTMTDTSGKANCTFKVNKTSGVAFITATITSPDGLSVTRVLVQNIDHGNAYYAGFSYPTNGTVASQVPFNVSITDQYGNPVDSRRGNHIISLHVNGPAPDDCGFVEAAFAHDITQILDANGNTSVNVKLTSTIGENNIAMDAYQSIPSQLEWIYAEARGRPFSITQNFIPSGTPPTLPADNTSFFTIVYNLFDEYGNPTNEQYLWLNTSVSGEEKQFLSNNLGQVTVQYGPRSSIGEIVLTATAIGNATVTCTKTVKFKDTGAEIISLTANPDTMASHDKNPTFTTDLLATVADHSGNAVPGETVTFAIVPGSITYDGAYNVTSEPDLVSTSDITDVDGVAAVQFIPGGFTTSGNPGYDASATGHCTVIATWNSTSKTVPITWKNYPYLSVATRVTPLTVQQNGTIDVTIEFRGDGWALQPTPIDVVMCTDRSGSMLYDDPDRMYSVREAGQVFVDQMSTSRDYLGLVTFGRNGYISRPGYNSGISTFEIDNTYSYPVTYSDYATVDKSLATGSAGFTAVKTSLNSIVPDHGTPMRSAIYKSVNEIISNGHSGSVQAIILLSDGDYNWYGDPLARGTGYSSSFYGATDYGDLDTDYMTFTGLGSGQFSEQNMSVYAKDHNIKIYSIAFANTMSSGGRTTLSVLANATGGKYYVASATDIADIYTAIAGELKDNAGVNTTATVDFENVNVTGVSMPGDQVFNYVYHPTDSTKINWQTGVTNVTDQSADWAADSKLDFNVGTIKVGQIWNATFRLRVNQSGLIDVFGANSIVSFNGGTENLYLPQTFITVVPLLDVTDITTKELKLHDLVVTETGEIKSFLPVMWNTTYSGNKTITEQVYYRVDTGPWILFDTITHTYDASTTEYVDYAQLDVTKLPPGGYWIKVYATASDAADATIMLDNAVNVGNRGRTYIKLQ